MRLVSRQNLWQHCGCHGTDLASDDVQATRIAWYVLGKYGQNGGLPLTSRACHSICHSPAYPVRSFQQLATIHLPVNTPYSPSPQIDCSFQCFAFHSPSFWSFTNSMK